MTRFIRLISSLILSYLFASTTLLGQGTAVSATGHITAEVIPVFSAGETSQMTFGKFSPGPYGGEIHLTPASTISVVGSINKGMGIHNAASFYVSGDTDASYTISLPDSPVILKHSSSSKTMTIENWMSNPGPGTGAGILQDGYQIVYVGATLKVGTLSDNPVGVYAGTYTITFDFN
jgi:hypothetical protein